MANGKINTKTDSLLSSNTLIKNLIISINAINLRPNDLISFTLTYGNLGKYGVVEFKDTYNILEHSPISYSDLIFSLKDSADLENKAVFKITKAGFKRSNDGTQTAFVEFEDYNIYKMKASYISLGFEDNDEGITFNTIFKKIVDVLDLQDIVILEDKEKPKYYKNFVIPANISIYDFVISKLNEDNYFMYADRMGTFLSNHEKSNFAELPKSPDAVFTLNVKEQNNMFRIIESSGVCANAGVVSSIPSTDYYEFDPTNINVEVKKETMEDLYQEVKLNGSYLLGSGNDLPLYFYPMGVKQSSSVTQNIQKTNLSNNENIINNNQELKIFVAGLNINRKYNKVDVVYSKVKTIANNETDTLLSGVYVVTGVKDLIFRDKFVQELTLKRSDYSPGIKR